MSIIELDSRDAEVRSALDILELPDDSYHEPILDRKFLNPHILRTGKDTGMSTVSQAGSASINYCALWETLSEQMRLNRLFKYVHDQTARLRLSAEDSKKLLKVIASSFNTHDVEYDSIAGIVTGIRNLTLSFDGTNLNVSIKRTVSKITKVTKVTAGFRRRRRRPTPSTESILDQKPPATNVEEIKTPTELELKVSFPCTEQ